ncbi:sodium/potassium-transporting ATPase subunit beta-1 [Dermatophagoides farinae]|uniref:sodium/potassium-transporting ATPase subunit beta-1 n=1 Tax=Dermatophagoides farinae TaxID=6954 RepID=UPI003F609B9E
MASSQTENGKKNESYPLKDMNSSSTKTDETTPLTKHNDDNNGGENNVGKEQTGLEEKLSSLEKDNEAANQNTKRTVINLGNVEEILQDQKIRVIIGIVGCVLLLLAIAVIITLLILNANNDDKTHRFLRIVPRPRGPTNLVYYRHGDLKKESGIRSWMEMVKEIDEFLAPYRRPINASLCAVNDRSSIPDDTVCLFDLNTIASECLKPDYGYMSGSPCIFIVFNNITDWMPNAGSNDTSDTTGVVELECTTNTQFDAENIGPMEFTPYQGFSSVFFPYKKQINYMAPFVALRLPSPTQNVGIGLTCRLLASNLQPSSSLQPPTPPPSTLLNQTTATVTNMITTAVDYDYYTQEPVPYLPFNIYIE